MPRHPPNALTSRLKTRTTNDITARGQMTRGQYGLQTISIVSCHIGTPQGGTPDANPRHRSKKPIHNVKKEAPAKCRTLPYHRCSKAAANWLPHPGMVTRDERASELVEPIGIEPMTSSLQS